LEALFPGFRSPSFNHQTKGKTSSVAFRSIIHCPSKYHPLASEVSSDALFLIVMSQIAKKRCPYFSLKIDKQLILAGS